MLEKSEIAIIGLGTMGAALARNFLSKGFSVAGYNRNHQKVLDLPVLAQQKWQPCASIEVLLDTVQRPRKILLMLPAGQVVEDMLATLLPLLDAGDIVLDGGNSYFEDTQRRCHMLKAAGIHFFGLGVSGGEEGALHGPSLMPGGAQVAYAAIQPYLESIAAKKNEQACCTFIGSDGAGHYVKMVHNGIEYADMQLLAEIYVFLQQGLGLSNADIATVFAAWNQTELRSYLVEISAKILLEPDMHHKENVESLSWQNDAQSAQNVSPRSSQYLLDAIVDKASQKGTGTWTTIEAFRQGQAVSLMDGAVQARIISNLDELRSTYKRNESVTTNVPLATVHQEVECLRKAYVIGKRLAYAQGFALMHDAGIRHGWQLNLGAIAAIFRKGCIIQAALLEDIMQSYTQEPNLMHLLMHEPWKEGIMAYLPSLRQVVLRIVEQGLAAPLLVGSLTYFDQLACPVVGANLIQAQRDFFGAHTFMRKDTAGAVHHAWNR